MSSSAVAAGGEADELGGGDEQPLVPGLTATTWRRLHGGPGRSRRDTCRRARRAGSGGGGTRRPVPRSPARTASSLRPGPTCRDRPASPARRRPLAPRAARSTSRCPAGPVTMTVRARPSAGLVAATAPWWPARCPGRSAPVGGDVAGPVAARSWSRSAHASAPGATPSSRRRVRSRRSNWRSAAWRSPAAAYRRISSTWACSSPGSSSTIVAPTDGRVAAGRGGAGEAAPAAPRPTPRSGPAGSSSPPYRSSARRARSTSPRRAPGGPARRTPPRRRRRRRSGNSSTVSSRSTTASALPGRSRAKWAALCSLGAACVERVVRPHEVDDLLAVEAAAGRQRQDLDQRRGVAPAPSCRPGRRCRRPSPRTVRAGRSRPASPLVPLPRAVPRHESAPPTTIPSGASADPGRRRAAPRRRRARRSTRRAASPRRARRAPRSDGDRDQGRAEITGVAAAGHRRHQRAR